MDIRTDGKIKLCDPLTKRATPERFCDDCSSRKSDVYQSNFYLFNNKTNQTKKLYVIHKGRPLNKSQNGAIRLILNMGNIRVSE